MTLAIVAWITLLPLVALIARRLWYAILSTSRLGGVPCPPIVPAWIPFVGHALSFTEGEDFWQTSCERRPCLLIVSSSSLL